MSGNQTINYFSRLIDSSKELKRKEKEILKFRLGFKILKKIGRKYKVSYERIRQIEKEAIKKLNKKICQLLLFD
jgi:DNA-directed RNA polymerase sigma subunit (sigma70/sigma32)